MPKGLTPVEHMEYTRDLPHVLDEDFGKSVAEDLARAAEWEATTPVDEIEQTRQEVVDVLLWRMIKLEEDRKAWVDQGPTDKENSVLFSWAAV